MFNKQTDQDLEKAIIGVLVISPEHYFDNLQSFLEVQSKHFTIPSHQKIWNLFKISSTLPSRTQIIKESGIKQADLDNTLIYASTISNYKNAGDEIIKNYKNREILNQLEKFKKDENPNPDDLVESIKAIESNTEIKRFNEIFQNPSELLANLANQKGQEYWKYQPNSFKNIKLKIPKSSLLVIGARAKVGKTTLALQVAKGLSYETKVAFFSLEMTTNAVTNKFLALPTLTTEGTNPNEIRKIYGDYAVVPPDQEDINHLQKACIELEQHPVHFCHGRITVEQIIKMIREAKNQGFGVFVIDQLSKISYNDYKKTTKQKYDEIVDKLSVASKELEVCVILLSQCNRNINSRDDKSRPDDSDISDTDRILQEADILFIGANKNEYKTATNWLVVNRNGQGGYLELPWDQKLAIHILNF